MPRRFQPSTILTGSGPDTKNYKRPAGIVLVLLPIVPKCCVFHSRKLHKVYRQLHRCRIFDLVFKYIVTCGMH
ncbi:hypothetical protein Fuma_00736 [Fuerstiella marisgermanici]|uniref:Uncharacterized protein n=1 Tax=Fuerstiella marisgermanici TaxID=1891926 RepID=A0A1P8WAR6_9PLAN|nr:hypothetical protein Fuma_00736 [Fuerstiella marisgermanici]